MTKNIRFIPTNIEGRVEIRARRKDTGKYDTLGYCNQASVALFKKDGIKAHSDLITFAR